MKPVAWIPKDHLKEMGKAGFRYTGVSYQQDKFYDVPLYTHPVDEKQSKFDGNNKVKELTDEEIVRISETCDLNHVLGLIDFARAILRKAQENG